MRTVRNSFHQLAFRVSNPFSEDPRSVPDMIIHGFYKNSTTPTTSEGFHATETIHVMPTQFSSPLEAFLWSGFLEG